MLEPTEILESPQRIKGTIVGMLFKEIGGRNGPFKLLEFKVRIDQDCPLAGVLAGHDLSVGYACNTFNRLTRLGTLAQEAGAWDGESPFDEQLFLGVRVAAIVNLEEGTTGAFWNIDRNSVVILDEPKRPIQQVLPDGIEEKIKDYVLDQDKGEGVSMESVVAALQKRGMSQGDAEAAVNSALEKGLVSEPRLGTLVVIKL